MKTFNDSPINSRMLLWWDVRFKGIARKQKRVMNTQCSLIYSWKPPTTYDLLTQVCFPTINMTVITRFGSPPKGASNSIPMYKLYCRLKITVNTMNVEHNVEFCWNWSTNEKVIPHIICWIFVPPYLYNVQELFFQFSLSRQLKLNTHTLITTFH